MEAFAAALLTTCTVLVGAGPALAGTPVTLTVTTQATAGPDDTFSDMATISEAPSGDPIPTGTVTFNVYAPGNATCAGTPLFTSTNPVNAAGASAMSGTFSAIDGAGTYRFITSYSGDSTYAPVAGECGAAGESVTMPRLALSITTQATLVQPAGGIGYRFSDTATILGAPAAVPAPTGTVTFDVYGPVYWPFAYGAGACAGTPLFTSTHPVNAAGTSATSNMFAPVGPAPRPEEVYLFTTSYSGDAFYAPATSECGAAGESVEIPALPIPMPEFILRPPTVDGAEPVNISMLTFSPPRFTIKKAPETGEAKKFARRSTDGTRISYVLSRPGTVTITISKAVGGLNITGRGCVPATVAARKTLLATTPRQRPSALLRRSRCKASRMVGMLVRSGNAGTNSFSFTGRIGSRVLTPGSYLTHATVTPLGTPPSTAAATFQILPAA